MDNRPLLPDIFADAVLDLHFEAGVFRLTLAHVVPPAALGNGGEGPAQMALAPKAVLLLTEPGFASLCQVVDGARQQMAEAAGAETGSSPNFGNG